MTKMSLVLELKVEDRHDHTEVVYVPIGWTDDTRKRRYEFYATPSDVVINGSVLNRYKLLPLKFVRPPQEIERNRVEFADGAFQTSEKKPELNIDILVWDSKYEREAIGQLIQSGEHSWWGCTDEDGEGFNCALFEERIIMWKPVE